MNTRCDHKATGKKVELDQRRLCLQLTTVNKADIRQLFHLIESRLFKAQ